jgi:hypothetical protein
MHLSPKVCEETLRKSVRGLPASQAVHKGKPSKVYEFMQAASLGHGCRLPFGPTAVRWRPTLRALWRSSKGAKGHGGASDSSATMIEI